MNSLIADQLLEGNQAFLIIVETSAGRRQIKLIAEDEAEANALAWLRKGSDPKFSVVSIKKGGE